MSHNCSHTKYFQICFAVTPNRILSWWSIALAFSKLEHQNYIRWGKLGINQLHSICTFRISNWFVSLIHLVLDWSGKIWFKLIHCINLAKYLVATVAWVSFLCYFKKCNACKNFCGKRVKFLQVSAPTAFTKFAL